MPRTLLVNFSGGEVAAEVIGRIDLDLYYASGLRMQNFVPRVQGSMDYRSGLAFVHPSATNNDGRIERFKYNDEQVYILEFTTGKLRIYEDAELTLTSSSQTITGITQANPAVVTSAGHGYSNGDEVYITGVVGMTQVNGRFFRVAGVTANTFQLKDLFGNNVNSTGYTAYSSGGTSTEVYEVASPYTTIADIFTFQFAQIGNVMYLDHRDHAPRKLTRVSATSWTLATYSRTNDPFTGANKYPGCVTVHQGRVIHGSTHDNPDTFWISMAPDSAGVARYDDFTNSASNDDEAIVFPVSSVQGDVAYINWITSLPDFVAVGTTSGVLGLDGGGVGEAITPTQLRLRPLDPYGVQAIMPIANGSALFYMQKGSRLMRSFEYEILTDGYKSFDRQFVATHLTVGGIRQIAFQRGRPDIIWAVCNNGKLIGLTLKEKADVSGWHQYKIGGGGKALSIAVEPQDEGFDRVWVLVERTINGTTVRYNEYFTDPFEGLRKEDYFTGDEDEDLAAFENETYEAQRQTTYLDSHLVFDGSDASGGTIAITPGAATGTGITFTASASLFTSADVGREIQKKYQDRAGGGRAVITDYISATQVECDILIDFDSTSAIPAGDWYLTTDSVSGLHHLEGETISVVADGAVQPDVEVSGGTITLEIQAAMIVLGYKYVGLYVSLPIVSADREGPTISNIRSISKMDIIVTNTIGTKYGTSMYALQEITSSVIEQEVDRPPLPFTGTMAEFYEDTWDDNKQVVIVQDQPYPCSINILNLAMTSGEE